MKLHSPLAERKPRIEIVPLIDVMFFLLASFMMVSLTLTKQQTIKVDLPTATSGQSDFKPDMINIAVDAQGNLFSDKQAITLPDLERKLAERFVAQPKTPVFISGDSNTRYTDLVKALDAVKRVGFSKVALNVKPTTPTPP
jgi:biopolymer transport protein ExbD